MIEYVEGHWRSIRTPRETSDLLEQDLGNLSEEERSAVQHIVSELSEPGNRAELLQTIGNLEWVRTPVDMRTFCMDPYYLGNTCDSIYPVWLEDLTEVFDEGYRECIFTGAIGTGKCVHPDTEVFDPGSGCRRRVGDLGRYFVTSMTSDGRIISSPATAMESGTKPCVRLVLRGGQCLILSTDHPVFTGRGWVRAGDIALDDLIATPRSLPEPKEPLCVSDDEVLVVAYLAADGGCAVSPTFTNALPGVLEEFVGAVKRLGGRSRPTKQQNSGRATTLTVAEILPIVRRWELDCKAPEKRVPAEFYGLDRRQTTLFLNRFWACGGYIQVRRQVKIEATLASEGLIDDLRFMLLRLGVHVRKRFKVSQYRGRDGRVRKFPAWRLTIGNRESALRFLDEVGDIFGKEEVCRRAREVLEGRKSNSNVDVVPVRGADHPLLKEELGRPLPKRWKRPPCQYYSRSAWERLCVEEGYSGSKRWLADSDLFWERVGSISDVGEHRVCDLSVPGTHSFVGNGIVVHNTFAASVGVCRLLYLLSCMRDPHRSFGIAANSNISIVCLAGEVEFYEGATGSRVRFDSATGGPRSVVGFDGQALKTTQSQGVISTGRREAFALRTSSGRTITATGDHKFLTLDRGWVPVNSLSVGRPVALAARLPEPRSSRHLSDAELRLLGYLVSEGDTTTKHVQFGNTDPRLIEEYVRDAKEVGCHDVTISVGKDKRPGRKTYYNARERAGKRGQRNVQYALATLCESHGLLGCSASEKRIPVAVMKEPNQGLAIFLNRLFAGDGSRHLRKRPDAQSHQNWKNFQFRYATTSSLLAKDVADALLRFGIFAVVRQVEPGSGRASAYYVEFSRKEFVQIFVREIGIFGREDSYATLDWRGFVLTTGDVCWDEIVDISSVGEVDTYCIQDVQGDPWFVANGFITHNCISVNEVLATKVAYENIATKIEASPYFQEHFPFEKTKKELRFPKKVWVAARASNDGSVLGLNVISCLLDECVTGETLVTLSDGRRCRVDGLPRHVPVEVVTFDAAGESVCSEAFVKRSTDQRCYELELDNGMCLRASGTHPVLTRVGDVLAFNLLNDILEGTEVVVYVGEGSEALRDGGRETLLRGARLGVRSLGRALSVARVVSKRDVGVQPTYDISVPGYECFVADGVVVHNTNFMPKASKGQDPRFNLQDRAEVLYNAIYRRMKSRFERKGRLPGVLFVVSSKQTNDDFTARRVRASMRDPAVFVRDYALWHTKPEEYYSGDWFYVVVGNEQVPSRIVGDAEDIDKVRKGLPEGCVVASVPRDFLGDFEKDLEGAIRDLAGVATVSVSPYIQRRTKIIDAIRRDMKHPFSVEIYDPSKPGRFFWNRMIRPAQDAEGGNRPILGPYAPRHIHIDPSMTGDSTGFAMGHISGWREVIRRDDEGNKYPERAPEITIDVLLKIVPPIGGEIILGEVRKLVYQLSQRGYMITCVSIDSWNSADAIQKLTQRGFSAMQLSVDRTMGPYDLLKAALYEDRLLYYEYEPLLQELRELEHDRAKRKVDHPLRGCKDLADAVAGVVWTLTENSSSLPLTILRSAPEYGDAWMQEHMEMVLAQGRGSSEAAGPGDDFTILPPFLVGSGGGWGD